MLHAVVLICSLAVTDCTEKSARDVMQPPGEFASPVTCVVHGWAYVADTDIGRTMAEDERIVVLCPRSRRQD